MVAMQAAGKQASGQGCGTVRRSPGNGEENYSFLCLRKEMLRLIDVLVNSRVWGEGVPCTDFSEEANVESDRILLAPRKTAGKPVRGHLCMGQNPAEQLCS